MLLKHPAATGAGREPFMGQVSLGDRAIFSPLAGGDTNGGKEQGALAGRHWPGRRKQNLGKSQGRTRKTVVLFRALRRKAFIMNPTARNTSKVGTGEG